MRAQLSHTDSVPLFLLNKVRGLSSLSGDDGRSGARCRAAGQCVRSGGSADTVVAMLRSSARRLDRRALTRSVWSHARPLQVRQVWADGRVEEYIARPLEIVSSFKILPRDLRLLKTRGANIAVRPDYFLFRLPPFTGCVRRDSTLLLTDGPSAATDVLQHSLLSQIMVPTEEDQLHTSPFELRVLETALREDLLSKQERFTRLAALIHTVSNQRGGLASPSRHGIAPRSSLFVAATREGTEHTLYRLLTLSNSLAGLEVDVRRTFAALTALLSSDEDMATMCADAGERTGGVGWGGGRGAATACATQRATQRATRRAARRRYLSHAAAEGEQRPIEEHAEVEIMLCHTP